MKLVEKEVEAGRMEGVKILFITGRYMAETVYYWRDSSNKDIFDLMLRLVYLYPRVYFRLHIIWVSGTR